MSLIGQRNLIGPRGLQEQAVGGNLPFGTQAVDDFLEETGVEACDVELEGIARPLTKLGEDVGTQGRGRIFGRHQLPAPLADVADAAVRFRLLPEVAQQHTAAATLSMSMYCNIPSMRST